MQFTVLVVDDNAINLSLIAQLLLKIDGVSPVSFTDAMQAIIWCESNAPDLLLVDYMMPVLDGLEFIKRFRALPGKMMVPVIMVTAAIEREVKLRALELHANDFINKPLDTVEFTARVRNMLALRKMQLKFNEVNFEQIRQHELQYRAVIETSKDGFLVVDMQGRILETNDAYACLSGYSAEELVTMNIGDLEAKMSASDVAHVLTGLAEQGHARFETQHKTWSGHIWPVEINVTYIAAEGGRCFSFLHDISQRKQDEAQLRKLSQAVEQSPNSNVICDTNGVIEYVNAAFTAITGYSASEAIGRKTGFFKSGLTQPEVYAALWQTLQQGEVWQGEFINRRKNGEDYTDFAIVSPIRQADGEITHYVAIQKDITQKKLMDEELEIYRRDLEALVVKRTSEMFEAKTQAEAANKAKSEFLANMSHEIRTPMNAIIGFNELCLRTQLSDKQKDYLTKAGSAAQSLLHIINEVLDLSKIEAGQHMLEAIPLKISRVVKNVTDLIGVLAVDKGLTIHVDLDEHIEQYPLRGDPMRLQQILLNLCSNAIKFSTQGSISIRCQLGAISGQAVELKFAVQDSGIGISPAQLGLLFKPFSQADSSTTRRFGGTGLGLSICRGLVERMGGRIWVESEPGIGSTFCFTVRFVIGGAPSGELLAQAHSREQLEQKMTSLRGSRVLLVEDNAFNQQVMGEMLRDVGLQFDLAENGQDALDQLARSHYDVVLMDLQMPVMDGLTACERLRSNPVYQNMPVIALTANVDQSDKDRCIQAGMSDHLSKPVVPEQLYSALLRWIVPVKSIVDAPLVASPIVADESELPDLPGINAGPVIKRMRGNVPAYLRLHGLFCQQAQGVPRALREAMAAEDFDAARRLVHTVKGSAGTIGADQLSAAAAVLEQAYRLSVPAGEVQLSEFETALAIVMAGQL